MNKSVTYVPPKELRGVELDKHVMYLETLIGEISKLGILDSIDKLEEFRQEIKKVPHTHSVRISQMLIDTLKARIDKHTQMLPL